MQIECSTASSSNGFATDKPARRGLHSPRDTKALRNLVAPFCDSHRCDARAIRSFPEPGDEGFDRFGAAASDELDATVRQITHPSIESERLGVRDRARAIEDALNLAFDVTPYGDGRSGIQGASTSSSAASDRLSARIALDCARSAFDRAGP